MTKKIRVFEKYPSRNVGELALLISDHITAMLAYWDKDLVCRYANSAYVDWFGKTKEQLINNIRIDELLGPLYEKNLHYIKGVLLVKKQVFELKIPIPDGSGVRHSLATYIPDIINENVLGFFVHVADVGYLKDLEKEISFTKRETLRKIIEVEETEKRHLVDILRESVNQTLTACKLEIERERKKEGKNNLCKNVSLNISEIIKELNQLCRNLAPTEIDLLGLIEPIEQYLAKMAKLHHKTIDVVFEDDSIEKLSLKDKYLIFRIFQNFITIAFDSANIKSIEASIKYTEPKMKIKFVTDNKMVLNKSSKEYHAIACRVDYYAGEITEFLNGSKSVFEIEFPIIGGVMRA